MEFREEKKECAVIRQATAEDALKIAGVHVQSWQGAYKGIVPEEHLRALSIEKRADGWQKTLTESAEGTFVAEESGVVFGWVSFGTSRDEGASNAGEVYGLYVHPDHWGHGFGRDLMRRAETDLRQQGYGLITLWVLELNERARRFYSKTGYAFDGTKKQVAIGGADLSEIRYSRRVVRDGK